MSDNHDDGIKHKFLALQTRKKIIAFASISSLVIASGLFVLSSYAYADVSVRDIQLLLALDGYELDPKSIDGKLGEVTKKSIRDYRKRKNLPEAANDNELIDPALFKSLDEDISSKFFSPPKVEQFGTQETGGQSGGQKSNDPPQSNTPPPTDANSKAVDVYASSIAAIYAARHSTEETKDFYEVVTGIAAAFVLIATFLGFKSVKDVMAEFRSELERETTKAKDDLSKLNGEYKDINIKVSNHSLELERKMTEIDKTIEGKITALDTTIAEVAEKIDKLVADSHANMSAAAAACSANVYITTFIYQESLKDKKSSEDQKSKILLREAEELCNRALEYDPKEPKTLAWIYGMQGLIFGETNRLLESCQALKKAVENDPENERILCNAACGFALAGKNAEALGYLKKAVEIQPSICEWAKKDPQLHSIKDDPQFPCR